MALELVLVPSEIYTHKRRDITVVDIPGTLLTADIDEYFIMVMRERLSELMANT